MKRNIGEMAIFHRLLPGGKIKVHCQERQELGLAKYIKLEAFSAGPPKHSNGIEE